MARPDLPTLGTNSYNGVTFDSKCHSDATARYLYDQAERTVVATVWTLNIYQLVQNDNATDAQLAIMRNALSKPGQQLVYTNNGFGGLNINTGITKDVMWGPKPRVLKLRRLGGANAVELAWTCEIAIPECTNATFQGALMAFNYKVRFDVDQPGLTTRQISGYYEIPMTRIGGGTRMPDHAENYWPQVFGTMPLVPGFDRRVNSREFSEDKRRCDFAIVDTEMAIDGNPPNITSFTGAHDISSIAPGTVQFFSNLSASYVVAKGVDRSAATNHFLLMLQNRLNQSVTAAKTQKTVMVVDFRSSVGVGDNRGVSCSCTWRYASTIADCMNDSGQFNDVPNVDWQTWINSPGIAAAKGMRGYAGIFTSPSDDAILDLCLGGGSTLTGNRGFTQKLTSQAGQDTQYDIDPNYSWLAYNSRIVTDQKNQVSVLKGLGTITPPKETTGTDAAFGVGLNPPGVSTLRGALLGPIAGANDPGSLGQLKLLGVARKPDTIQNRTSPTYKITLIGYAVRGGYPIPYPNLTQYQGQPCTQVRAYTDQDIVANWSGVPIYYAEWEIDYVIPNIPNAPGIPVPVNPLLGFQ